MRHSTPTGSPAGQPAPRDSRRPTPPGSAQPTSLRTAPREPPAAGEPAPDTPEQPARPSAPGQSGPPCPGGPAPTVARETPPADRPWLGLYDAGVPADVEIPDQPLPALLAASAARVPDRPALRFFGRSITYRALDQAANRFAQVLLDLGVRKGDRVALLMPNCPQMVLAYYGGLRAGAVIVPTSPLYVESELEHQLADAEPCVVVCLSALYPRLERVLPNLPSVHHVLVTSIKDYFPLRLRLVFTLVRERRDGHHVRLPADGRALSLPRLLDAAPAQPPAVDVHADDLAVLQYTGGTTGLAKAAMLSHRNLLANTLQVRAWFINLANADGSDVVLGVLPLFHVYAMTTVLNFSIAGGGTIVLLPRFSPGEVLDAIAHEHPQLVPGVPTMYLALSHAQRSRRDDHHLHSLKGAISGAAPLPREVQVAFESLTGARLVEGYGLTEASPVTHCAPLGGEARPGSIGLPLPSTLAAIVDPETGTRRLGPGEVGELIVRGPQVMGGYWKRPDETAQVLRDGWLLTGDLARMDADGRFSIVDRKKDLIITGGLNVYPRDVEEPLYQHPKIREVVAVGIPDERWGEAVKVYIVLEDGESATEQEILEYCHAHMARYKVPKFVEFRQELPKSVIGKVLRRQLLADEHARHSGTPPVLS